MLKNEHEQNERKLGCWFDHPVPRAFPHPTTIQTLCERGRFLCMRERQQPSDKSSRSLEKEE